LIRLTFEAQLPPTLLSLAYVIEWCELRQFNAGIQLIACSAFTPASLLGAVFQVSALWVTTAEGLSKMDVGAPM
jgi:hypothetical protein